MELRYVNGHIEVWINGRFAFSADTVAEARKDILLQHNACPRGYAPGEGDYNAYHIPI